MIDSKDIIKAVNNNYEKVFDPRILVDDDSKNLWSSASVDLAQKGLAEGYKLKETPYNARIKTAFLRRANLPFKYTDFEIEEIEKVIYDKIYYGNTYAKLKDGDKGWVNIKLRNYQEDILNQYSNNRWNILLLPRQSGKTTTTVIEITHFCISNFDKDVIVIAQSDKVVKEILSKIRECFESLPFFLQPGFVKFTDEGFELDNGCRLRIGIASESVIQGFSVDLLFIDEFAYISNNMIDSFWANIYPSLVNNTKSKCIIASTPNGRNLFHTLWTKAVSKENKFIPYRIYWYEVPGRDEQFKKDTIANVGIMGWEMGFECNFDVGMNSIFSTASQKILRDLQTNNINKWVQSEFNSNLIIYDNHKFSKDNFYLIPIDISEGLGGDYSIIKIIQVIWSIHKKRLEYKTVGMIRTNELSVNEFALSLLFLLPMFNQNRIQVIVENNNYGGEFFSCIDSYRLYHSDFNFVNPEIFTKFTRESSKIYERGLRWNKYNKPIAVKEFSKYVQNGIIHETENVTIEEMLNFCKNNKTGTFAANYGHDDTVMSLITLSHFLSSKQLVILEWLKMCERELRLLCNDEPEDIKQLKLELEKQEKHKYTNIYGFTEHNCFKEKEKSSNLFM